MSHDRYSNTHTIEVLNSSEDLSLITNSGTIYLKAVGAHEDSDIRMECGDSFVVSADDQVAITSKHAFTLKANYGKILLEALDSDIELKSFSQLKLTSGADGGGVWLESLNGDVEIKSQNNIIIDPNNNFTAEAPNQITIKSVSGDADIKAPNGAIDMDANTVEITATSGPLALVGNNDVGLIAQNGDMQINADGEMHIHTKGGHIIIESTSTQLAPITLSAPNAQFYGIELDASVHINEDLTVGKIKGHGVDPLVIESSVMGTSNSASGYSYAMIVRSMFGTAPAGGGSDGIRIDPNYDGEGPSNPKADNNWLQFYWNGASKGAIQGAEPVAGISYAVKTNVLASPLTITAEGNAQFASGNQDFGEFFEVGNIEEWGPLDSESNFSLQEGLLVWVVGEKFYKTKQEGAGVPFLVTKRAIIAGSALSMVKGSGVDKKGEILSFIGKLPVIVKGAIEVGDLIIPVDNENVCKGLPKSEASLQDYMAALGTALTSCPEESILPDDHPLFPGEKTNLHMPLCAIGIK